MQIYRAAKKFDGINIGNSESKNMIIEDSDLWIKLDEGLKKIENEWRKRMSIEKYLLEFTKQNSVIVDDVDDLTVEELKCWFRLLNIKLDSRYGDLYFQTLNNILETRISIIYWIWTYNDKKHLLIDISFKIKNKEEYGAIFENDNVLLINSKRTLCKTDNTSIELEQRISALEAIR